ncbi:phosphoglycerate kinase [Halarsenatibacter silvermanii]|uniref:Phosphoglycerate kinase n=1 Tax=Halarsenatibacter silvermanii TaxID=321763 RepID=A0A1G9RQG4_9FIRM|nr:phosphoglycerate kinase [Halarsenatibacter silvermanii]SDM25197.1 phosphoglycerate kinase [Halarsenatibacter silvermanii]
MDKKTLKDFDFAGKNALVRVDFNVPLKDGKVDDNTRIDSALDTIDYLIREEARVILMSHLGRPGGSPSEELRMDPVAEELAELLGREVKKVDDCIGPEVEQAVESMEDGDVLLLENTRFYPGEKENDPEFARKLAAPADVFVNDAFGAAHRAHASTAGVAEYLPAVAGFLMQREINSLGEAMENPESPYAAIIGGAKISDKMSVIKNLLDKCDQLLLGGGIANTFLLAQGFEVGDSLVEEDRTELAQEILSEAKSMGVEVLLPEDVVIAEECEEGVESRVVDRSEVPAGWQILDIGGPRTLEKYTETIKNARTVTWNGPLGVFEIDAFAEGTMQVARALAESEAYKVVGGGESAAAIRKAGVEEKMSHVSTGGGASLTFFEGEPLPGVEILDDLE